jgi:hypothetical protein
MSRRRRAAAFLLAAVLAAVAAAAIVESYGGSVSRGYGALRPAVIAVAELPGGEAIAPRALAVRRVPARFVPPGALVDPAQALGLVPAADLPAGAYLLTTQLRPPRDGPRPRRGLGRGRHPVELLVSGAGALSAASPIDGSRVRHRHRGANRGRPRAYVRGGGCGAAAGAGAGRR